MDVTLPLEAVLSGAATVAAGLFAGYKAVQKASFTKGYAKAKAELGDEREMNRFREIYAPLIGHFTTVHVVFSVAMSPAPGLRWMTAKLRVKEGEYREAWKAMFGAPKPIKRFGEVEYGGCFPLDKITKHLKGREHFADSALIGLVAQANRSTYEDYELEENELNEAEIALYEHIDAQHRVLSERFAGSSIPQR